MEPVKIPKMQKNEYDTLIERQYVSRISFGACDHPYVAPFMYVFDKKYLNNFFYRVQSERLKKVGGVSR